MRGSLWLPVLAWWMLAPSAVYAQGAAAPALASPRNDVAGLSNLARISPALWRSAQPTRDGFRAAKRLGIRTVVSLRRFHSDRKKLAGLGLRYVHIPMNAWRPKDAHVLAFLKTVLDPANQPVLVHCQHGSDRTGLMVATYRVAVQGWTKARALQELPRFGFHAIWRNLRTYFRRLDVAGLRRRLPRVPAPAVRTP